MGEFEGGRILKRWSESVGRTNAVFITLFSLVVLAVFSVNVYEHMRYSRLELTEQGHTPVSLYTTVWAVIRPTTVTAAQVTFDRLRTSWWASPPSRYLLGDPQHGFSFRVQSTASGDFVLIPAFDGPVMVPVVHVENQKGRLVRELRPGLWYRVRENGQWYQIRLQWQ